MPPVTRRKSLRAATLADVGREAGVSAMAASTVLNGARTSSRISPETRQRIIEAAEKLRYRPNAAARALADRRMNTLGVAAVFDGNQLNQYFLEVFNGVVEAAARHNQNTTVFTLHDWHKDVERLPGFCDGRIDGLILIGPTFTREALEMLPEHTPCVAVHSNHDLPRLVNLESDEEKGARDATAYLISKGHRRIMHLAGPKDLLGAQRRLRGYKRALADARIEFDPALVVQADFSMEGGTLALSRWLKEPTTRLLPQAIFCANDALAMGAMEALAKMGFRVPTDISIVGFDDTLAARSTVPQLTTVRQPLRAMGVKGVEVLLDRIQSIHSEKSERAWKNIVFTTELVERGSAGPAPKIVHTLRE
ncbi:MAG TPA: LacI family DNA-binding transcriptional regulator [Opitutaceae bacterium]|nr:LacI family DNA-binding transcriptional regulator [Opitutaceae bacterium]